jgi:hypothetical protein
MLLIRFFLCLLFFASCSSTKVLKKKPLPTTFEADSSFFDAVNESSLFYTDLSGVILLSSKLKA